MTNPVILLGTQSNGETLPVQVDATGRLVAEGLQGPPGPPGPGFELPPDPYEGALLGWMNGGLAWIGGEPVPIPPGVFGPITSWDPQSAYLTVEGEIPDNVGTGVYLYQCNSDGTLYTEGWNTSSTWSDRLSGLGTLENPVQGFDGDLSTYASCSNGGSGDAWIRFTRLFEDFNKFELLTDSIGDNSYATGTISLNSGEQLTFEDLGVNSFQKQWIDLTPQLPDRYFVSLEAYQRNKGSYTLAPNIYGIRVNDLELVDESMSLNFRVQSLLGNGFIGSPSSTVDFTVGKYLRIPEQRVAPWVLYGNDPTSLIDHLRST